MSHRKGKSHWKQFANIEIFSNLEILAFISLFLFLAIIVFPKEKLSQILLTQEDYNLDLSRLYLEKLLKIEFNPKLFSLLVEKDIKLGRYDEAYELIDKYLRHINSRKTKTFLLQLKIKLLVSKYFSVKSKKEKEKIKEELHALLKNYIREFQGLEDYKFTYEKATAFGFKDVAFLSCRRLAELTGEETYYKELVTLALSLKDKNLIIETLKTSAEKVKSEKFKKELFKLAISLREKKLAEEIAQKLLMKNNLSYKDFKSLIDFELSYKDYDRAIHFCQLYFKKNQSFKVLKLCINLALWKKDFPKVRELIEKNLDKYSNNEEVLVFFLRVARATNNGKLALKVADRLLERLLEETR